VATKINCAFIDYFFHLFNVGLDLNFTFALHLSRKTEGNGPMMSWQPR
jgi:hypothetical protein